MSELILSRWQFAITTSYHFLFVPLTLGLSILVAIMETLYVRTGNEVYKKMTKFWGKLFIINFTMGVVTGIVQEFHFGMNWSEYARFMGDIFGAPLALEALTAFFLESTFIGLWIFGWDKLSKPVHALTIWLVAFATNLSAFWILVANSFMQAPVGYAIRNGRAEMTDIVAILTNTHVLYQYPHTVLAGLTTAAVFILGISAYQILKKNETQFFLRSVKIGAITGAISIVLVILIGHFQGVYLMNTQPMKMAAAEGVWNTTSSAPFSVVAVIDESNQSNSMSLDIPLLGSLISHHDASATVKGIKDLQKEAVAQYGSGNYVPPVALTYWSFRLMILTGLWMLFIILYAYALYRKGTLQNKTWVLKALLWTLPIPYLANLSGWFVAEIGRQPWIVQGLQRVSQAVSPNLTPGEVLLTTLGFTLIYACLAGAAVYLAVKHIKQGLNEAPSAPVAGKEVSLWN